MARSVCRLLYQVCNCGFRPFQRVPNLQKKQLLTANPLLQYDDKPDGSIYRYKLLGYDSSQVKIVTPGVAGVDIGGVRPASGSRKLLASNTNAIGITPAINSGSFPFIMRSFAFACVLATGEETANVAAPCTIALDALMLTPQGSETVTYDVPTPFEPGLNVVNPEMAVSPENSAPLPLKTYRIDFRVTSDNADEVNLLVDNLYYDVTSGRFPCGSIED